MGCISTKSEEKNYMVLMIGINNAGKTSILHKLKFGHADDVTPTTAFNVERIKRGKINYNIFDISGEKNTRLTWKYYFQHCNGVIFVVDSNDANKLDNSKYETSARDEIRKIFEDDEIGDVPFLVFANKQDIKTSISKIEIVIRLELENITSHEWYVQESSAITGDGLNEGLEWLTSAMERKAKK